MSTVCALEWSITFSTQPAKAMPKLKMDVCGPGFVFCSNSLMMPRLFLKLATCGIQFIVQGHRKSWTGFDLKVLDRFTRLAS